MRFAGGDLAIQDRHLGVDQCNATLAVLERRRHRGLTHANARAGGIDQAHRLVGQLARRDVARRQPYRLTYRLVEDADLVVLLQRGDQTAYHGDRHRLRWFVHLHHLEPPGQRGILFEVLLVFGPGGGGDCAQLTARQRRLQQVGGVALPGRTTGADQLVRLVDEHDDRLRRSFHLVDDTAQPVLELALHAGARLQQPKIERAQRHPLQTWRHVAGGKAHGETFDNRGLADAGLAGEDRIVLPPPRQDVDDLADLGVAAEDRIDLAGARLRRQIGGELIERAGSARRHRRAVVRGACLARHPRLRLRCLRAVGSDRCEVPLQQIRIDL